MIETARLRLRRGTEADIPGLVAALNDWDVARWLQRPPFPYSADDARAFLRWSGAHGASAPPVAFVVADRFSDRLLGTASHDVSDARASQPFQVGHCGPRPRQNENVSGLTRIRVCRHLDVHPRLASHGVDVGGVGDAREPHHRNP